MSHKPPIRIKTITEYHRGAGLPKPAHPHISVIDVAAITPPITEGSITLVFDFYTISCKKATHGKFKYGQKSSDFDEGTLFFMSPGQVFGFELAKELTQRPTGWMILIHPDFLWNTPLGKTIKHNEFFDYSVDEALFLSEREEAMLISIAHDIEEQYQHIDQFTQNIIIANLQLLFSHAERFYQRQFITRKVEHHEILKRLEDLLTNYFNSGALATLGLPTVTYIADKLHMSPGYCSSMLKSLTGQTTQQHLHNKLIELAKEKLSTTSLSISEIAYELGFEHLQSFTKLFKHRTQLSPLAFRQSFN